MSRTKKIVDTTQEVSTEKEVTNVVDENVKAKDTSVVKKIVAEDVLETIKEPVVEKVISKPKVVFIDDADGV
jgi:UDP-N-acetyl-D-mannosaminuronic acid transferase (WecB/TagA/CpsF family)